jgi:dihydroorotate dehydrogenase (fumarate)
VLITSLTLEKLYFARAPGRSSSILAYKSLPFSIAAESICTASAPESRDLYARILDDLPGALAKYNFSSVRDVINTTISKGEIKFEPGHPVVDREKCTLCGLCGSICPYFAIKVEDSVSVDNKECFGCGLCESRCPSKAISGVL